MLEINFKIARQENQNEILEFLRTEFYKNEPMTVAHPIPGHTEDDEEFAISHLHHESTILAFDKETNQLVGILVAGPVSPGDAEHEIENARTIKWFELARLLTYIERKANVCHRFNVTQSLHIHIVSVKESARGNRIGKQLFEECFEIARRKGYSLVSTDCTSIHSVKIAEQLGMEVVSEVKYEEYNKIIMGNFFKIIPPNDGIKTFAIRIK